MAELFTNFEVNKDLRWPLILKLLGGSLALHSLLLILVVYVPGLRDAFNIATLIADTSFVFQGGRIVAAGMPGDVLSDVALLERTNLIHAHRHTHADVGIHAHPHRHLGHEHAH